VTPDPAETPEPSGPDPEDGPLDPFEEGVPLAAGPDDVGFLRTPSSASRLMSSFIDLMAAYLLVNVLNAIIIITAVHPGKKLTTAQQRDEVVAFTLVAVVVALGFVLLERYTGRSLGKRLLRLRLMTKAGVRPSVSQLVLRYAVMFLLGLFVLPLIFSPALGTLIALLALGYAAVQPQRRNVFDLIVGTRVVADTG
jgi:uncharacterized RDD family membrane protein YckC